ncbi:hypothetical protein MCOR31_011972, partial [Pyricularia oryzae]
MQASPTTMRGCDSQADQFDHAATAARELMRKVPLVDGHNDFAWILRGWLRNRLDHLSNVTIQDMPIGQTDVRRLREGQVGCQFWSAFVPDQGGLGAREPQLETLRTTLQQIDVLHAL